VALVRPRARDKHEFRYGSSLGEWNRFCMLLDIETPPCPRKLWQGMPQRLAELSMTHADPIRFLHNLVYVNIHNSGVVCTLVVVVCKRITDAE
jgi:hypothetical protein